MLERIQGAAAYIADHPHYSHELKDVSVRACISQFHFHRLFKLYTNMSLREFSTKSRLVHGAKLLAYRSNMSITDIAFECGFSSPEVFSRNFKALFETSPLSYRNKSDWSGISVIESELTASRTFKMTTQIHNLDVAIEHFASMDIFVLKHKGDQSQLGTSIQRFIQWRKKNGLHPTKSRTFNIIDVSAEQFDFRLACEQSKKEVNLEQDMSIDTLPELMCAKLVYKGNDSGLELAINDLYQHWLPDSGYEPDDHPLLLERISFYPLVPLADAQTHIQLPIKKSVVQ